MLHTKQCFSRVVSRSCFERFLRKLRKHGLLCDASHDLNHGDHNGIQLMKRNSPERSVVSFCGLHGNEKFGVMIVKVLYQR